MRIGVFLSTREDVVTFSPIYWILRKAGHKVYLYDVGVEAGWFEKGLQYLSLGYDRLSGHFDKDIPDEFIWSELDKLFEKIGFDYIVFMGYDLSLLPYLRYCYENGVRTIHIGSGLRRYDSSLMDYVSQLVDRYSMINFTYSPIHTKNLLDEGFDPTRVILTGYPIIDLVNIKAGEAVAKSTILDELGIDEGEYVLLILWRRDSLRYIDEILKFSEKTGEYLVCPTPKWGKRVLMGMDKYYALMERYDITFLESMDMLDHLALIINAKSVLTDAEWIYVEASLLGRPSLLLMGGNEKPLILEGIDVNLVRFGGDVSSLIVDRYMRRGGGNIRRFLDTSLIRDRVLDTLNRFDDLFVRNEVKLFSILDGRPSELVDRESLPDEIKRFLL